MVSVYRMKYYLRPLAGVFLIAAICFTGSVAHGQVLGEGEQVPGIINNEATITFEAKERPLADVLEHVSNIVGVNILLAPGIEESITLKLNDVPWRDALEIVAEKAGCIVVEKSSKIFRVEKPPRVSFTFTDEDIKKVITAIALSAGADVIIAPEVEGKVNMQVDNIPWKDALENVIKTLGYHMVEEERGVLRVVTSDSLIQQLETRIFELRYIRPRNVYVPTIKSEYITGENKPAEHDTRLDFPLLPALESLLSTSGKIDYFPRDNVIFAKDIKPVLDKIAEIIERLDQEPLQVEIDVQFVTVTKRDTFDASFGFAGLNGRGLEASWNGASKTTTVPFNTGQGSWGDTIMPGPLPPDTTVFGGTLNFSLIKFLVQLIEVSSFTRVTQSPKIVTLDHHEATINVGDAVRWAITEAKSSQAGTLEFTIKEADNSPVLVGFQLFVTPHIIPGTNKISLAVIPQAEVLSGESTEKEGFDKFEVGENGNLELFLPRVRTQTIVTNLLLESGQTGVIGGLVSTRDSEIITKVPWIGDIPVLGLLFKSKSTVNSNEELLVVMTPRIVKTASQATARLEEMLGESIGNMESEFDTIQNEED